MPSLIEQLLGPDPGDPFAQVQPQVPQAPILPTLPGFGLDPFEHPLPGFRPNNLIPDDILRLTRGLEQFPPRQFGARDTDAGIPDDILRLIRGMELLPTPEMMGRFDRDPVSVQGQLRLGGRSVPVDPRGPVSLTRPNQLQVDPNAPGAGFQFPQRLTGPLLDAGPVGLHSAENLFQDFQAFAGLGDESRFSTSEEGRQAAEQAALVQAERMADAMRNPFISVAEPEQTQLAQEFFGSLAAGGDVSSALDPDAAEALRESIRARTGRDVRSAVATTVDGIRFFLNDEGEVDTFGKVVTRARTNADGSQELVLTNEKPTTTRAQREEAARQLRRQVRREETVVPPRLRSMMTQAAAMIRPGQDPTSAMEAAFLAFEQQNRAEAARLREAHRKQFLEDRDFALKASAQQAKAVETQSKAQAARAKAAQQNLDRQVSTYEKAVKGIRNMAKGNPEGAGVALLNLWNSLPPAMQEHIRQIRPDLALNQGQNADAPPPTPNEDLTAALSPIGTSADQRREAFEAGNLREMQTFVSAGLAGQGKSLQDLVGQVRMAFFNNRPMIQQAIRANAEQNSMNRFGSFLSTGGGGLKSSRLAEAFADNPEALNVLRDVTAEISSVLPMFSSSNEEIVNFILNLAAAQAPITQSQRRLGARE